MIEVFVGALIVGLALGFYFGYHWGRAAKVIEAVESKAAPVANAKESEALRAAAWLHRFDDN